MPDKLQDWLKLAYSIDGKWVIWQGLGFLHWGQINSGLDSVSCMLIGGTDVETFLRRFWQKYKNINIFTITQEIELA